MLESLKDMICSILTIFTAVLYLANAKVSLNSSAVRVCPGSTLVFTCTTDTGTLVWSSEAHNHLYTSGRYSDGLLNNLFTLNLTNVTGMILISTATVQNVLLGYNGSNISCSDSTDMSSSMNRTIQISAPPPSPLNLTFTLSSTPCLVTISWVAPLDTPLCVHSYTVTVRNSCNSSQVMVYNTSDNRSSLNTTDLTSDGEYSVTVTGRDGAGQLGQESDKLKLNFSDSRSADETINFSIEHKSFLFNGDIYGTFIHWNYTNSNDFEQTNWFTVTHNVSSDQSPITVNRTNVTLYGVQPGKTYTVEIIFNLSTQCYSEYSAAYYIQDPNITHVRPSCTTTKYNEVCPVMQVGNIVSVAASVFLAVLMLCYILVCFCTSDFFMQFVTSSTTDVKLSAIAQNQLNEPLCQDTHQTTKKRSSCRRN